MKDHMVLYHPLSLYVGRFNIGCHGGGEHIGLILQLAMEITGAQVDITPGSPGLHPVQVRHKGIRPKRVEADLMAQ